MSRPHVGYIDRQTSSGWIPPQQSHLAGSGAIDLAAVERSERMREAAHYGSVNLNHLKHAKSWMPSPTAKYANPPAGNGNRTGERVTENSGGSVGPSSPVAIFIRQSLAVQFVLDAWTSHILCASEGAARALGYDPPDLKDQSFCDLVENLGLVEWAKAVGGLVSGMEGRKVILRYTPYLDPYIPPVRYPYVAANRFPFPMWPTGFAGYCSAPPVGCERGNQGVPGPV